MKMGYATVMKVPKIHNYADALKRYDNTKPIKGRQDDPRPLGERRYVDTYSIRKNIWTNAIECILYKTPVVKFTTEDEVVINIDNWPSASTCQFITRVLGGVGAYRVKGQVVLGFSGIEARAMLPAQGELVLVRNTSGGWIPKVKQTLYDYRISRKESNNVRKQVSQFKDYLSGVIKLKSEERVVNEGTHYERRFNLVKTTYGELIEVFGKSQDMHGAVRPDVDKWKITDKPKYYGGANKDMVWSKYREATTEFFDLVRNDQDDNARHQNYWIAYNILFVQEQSLYWRDNMESQVTLGIDQFEKVLEKILFKMFADKVFTKVALPEGKVPTGKYDDYVTTEED
jgi:hypothetical protein